MRYSFALVSAIMFCASLCHAAPTSATGTISLLRQSTSLQPNGGVQDVTLFQLSPALPSGCVWVWIPATDKFSASVAVAAKLAASSVVVWYDPTVYAPWGESDVCGLLSIDLT
jgi:hypothetical protein